MRTPGVILTVALDRASTPPCINKPMQGTTLDHDLTISPEIARTMSFDSWARKNHPDYAKEQARASIGQDLAGNYVARMGNYEEHQALRDRLAAKCQPFEEAYITACWQAYESRLPVSFTACPHFAAPGDCRREYVEGLGWCYLKP